MRAKILGSTEARFTPRTRQRTTKRRGFAIEFGLKVTAAVLGALGLACAMLCTYLYQSNGYALPTGGFYTALKLIESAWRGAQRPVCAAAPSPVLSWRRLAHSYLRVSPVSLPPRVCSNIHGAVAAHAAS